MGKQLPAMTMTAGLAESFPAVRTDQPFRLNHGLTAGTGADNLNRILRRTINLSLYGPDQNGQDYQQQQNHRYPAYATGWGVKAVSSSTEPSRKEIVRSK